MEISLNKNGNIKKFVPLYFQLYYHKINKCVPNDELKKFLYSKLYIIKFKLHCGRLALNVPKYLFNEVTCFFK